MPSQHYDGMNLHIDPEPLERAHPRLLFLTEHPDELVLRKETWRGSEPGTEDDEARQKSEQEFIDILLVLEEKYGIASPGFSNLRARWPANRYEDEGDMATFIAGQKVDGTDLVSGLYLGSQPEVQAWPHQREYTDEQIIEKMKLRLPLEVAKKAFNAIICYYSDVVKEGSRYLLDLSPENIMYGTTSMDPNPKLYFVDFDTIAVEECFDTTSPHQLDGAARRAYRQIGELIPQLEGLYGVKLPDLRHLIDELDVTQTYPALWKFHF